MLEGCGEKRHDGKKINGRGFPRPVEQKRRRGECRECWKDMVRRIMMGRELT